MKKVDFKFSKIKFLIILLMFSVFACGGDDAIELPDDIVITEPIDTEIQIAWVYFKDKPSKATYKSNPISMLTQRAIDRRIRQSIAIDDVDVPIEKTYYNQIKNSEGIKIKAKSKWLNALHVEGVKADINKLKLLSIVDKVEFANKALNTSGRVTASKINHQPQSKFTTITTDFVYGDALNQIKMLGGDVLHQQNFTGNSMVIAILDAGFPNVDKMGAFNRLRSNNDILGGFNFVERSSNYYSGHWHGTAVLSTIAGYAPPGFVGTAPDASFYLFVTEDDPNETPLEESLWVEAAEMADSLGVDIINSSLGYSTFDNSKYNHTYADLNGSTTFISRGAEIGVSRGMIIVNSAGNEGSPNDPWKYILAPADAVSVLSIGAVDVNKLIASFSSFGPTFDNRVKPDVLAQGKNVYIINSAGSISTGNGTSYASPIMAGVIACYWQKNQTKTNREIIQFVRSSGHLYPSFTAQEGYGIPKFN